jgi:hypothetical protein
MPHLSTLSPKTPVTPPPRLPETGVTEAAKEWTPPRLPAGVSVLDVERLVAGVAGGDEVALALLHRTLRAWVRRIAVAHVSGPRHVPLVVAATFVEVWHLARRRRVTAGLAVDWIADIAVRRAVDSVTANAGDRDGDIAVGHAPGPLPALRWHSANADRR